MTTIHETTTASLTEVVSDAIKFKSAVEEQVNAQYDTAASMAFYEYVMGGGGDDIHYGIFLTGAEDLRQSSQNSIDLLASYAAAAGALSTAKPRGTSRVLDLGSGKGGAARHIAQTYGCHVTCFNLGENQNTFNLRKAAEQGLGDLISTHKGSFNDALPTDWTGTFDLVWSQEALCHAVDQKALMAEVRRVLKPGGVVAFSDIMQGDNGGDCSSFTGQNVTAKLATPQLYKDAIAEAGMRLVQYEDLTPHLTPYFKRMLDAVKGCRAEMESKGVDPCRLDAYEADLVTRFDSVKAGFFAWGAFSATSP